MLALRLLTICGLVAWCTALSKESVEQNVIEYDYAAHSYVRDILVDNGIIDDVLDDFQPTCALDLAYPKHHESVALGNDIPVKAVTRRPTVSFHPFAASEGGDSHFTVVLTDPDALSKAEMCHWILVNLTLPAVPEDEAPHSAWLQMSAHELEKYKPPAPPKGTGKHRYVFVLLKGEAGTEPKPPTNRPHWGYNKTGHGVRDWAKINNLTVVGANFFFAQHEKQ